MTYQLDEIDQRIIHALMADARNTSAPDIAEDLNVSAGTIRNRIARLEDAGVIKGYSAEINFERAGYIMGVYMCTVPADEREHLAMAARSLPGVINVRVLMAGRRDLQIIAVAENTEDLRDIARKLSDLEIQIDNEELLQTELRSPYEPFGPDGHPKVPEQMDIISLANGTDVVEVDVSKDAAIVNRSIQTARDEGLLAPDVSILLIERGEQIIQPTGSTVIQEEDIVTLVPNSVDEDTAIAPFLKQEAAIE